MYKTILRRVLGTIIDLYIMITQKEVYYDDSRLRKKIKTGSVTLVTFTGNQKRSVNYENPTHMLIALTLYPVEPCKVVDYVEKICLEPCIDQYERHT